jgi:hypothetical protein
MFIDGISVPLAYEYEPVPPGTHPDAFQSTVAGDISPFTGQTVELKFTATLTDRGAVFHGLDSIYFSPLAVPEPSGWAFLGFGGAVLAWRWRRNTTGTLVGR